MSSSVRIVGLGGSLRLPSSSLAALKIALDGAAEAGASTELLSIHELKLPFFLPGTEKCPEGVTDFCEVIYRADGLIWSSPMYHGTISGAFKNAVDWLQLLAPRDPPFLTDKVVGLISTAGGTHGLQAVNTMEYAVRALRGWAVPLVLPIPQAFRAFDEAGQPNDPAVGMQLRKLGAEVARAARRFAGVA